MSQKGSYFDMYQLQLEQEKEGDTQNNPENF